jgi:hypothetical protein
MWPLKKYTPASPKAWEPDPGDRRDYDPLLWSGTTLSGAEAECDYRYGREVIKTETLKALPVIEALPAKDAQ